MVLARHILIRDLGHRPLWRLAGQFARGFLAKPKTQRRAEVAFFSFNPNGLSRIKFGELDRKPVRFGEIDLGREKIKRCFYLPPGKRRARCTETGLVLVAQVGLDRILVYGKSL